MQVPIRFLWSQHTLFLWVFLLAGNFWGSAQEVLLVSDSTRADQLWAKYSNSQKVTGLIAILKNQEPSVPEFEIWLKNKLEFIYGSSASFKNQDLFLLGRQLAKRHDIGNSSGLANYILDSDEFIQDSLLHGMAIALKAMESAQFRDETRLTAYLEELEHYIDVDTSDWISWAQLSLMGQLYEMQGEYFKAAVTINRALRLIDKTDTNNLYILQMNLSMMYNDMGFDEKAMFHAAKAVELIGIDHIPNKHLVNFAMLYGKQGRFLEADQMLNKQLNFSFESDLPGITAQVYANLGNLRRRQKRFQEALVFMALSDSICSVQNIEIGILYNKINRSELYFDMGEFNNAKIEIESIPPLLEKYNLPHLRLEYFQIMHRVLDVLGDPHAANASFRSYISIRDSILGDLPRSIISEWELAFEREQFALESNKLSVALKQEIKKKYQLALLLMLFILVFAFVFFWNNRRRWEERKRLEKEQNDLEHSLELKTKELLTETLHKVDVFSERQSIGKKLEKLVQDLPEQERDRFISLIKSLKTKRSSAFLKEFEARFKGVYEAFYKQLSALAPDLTANEIRVCSLIRLNLSTKEIAQLTSRSVGTIENSRIRIRKKLGLGSDENLQNFLLTL